MEPRTRPPEQRSPRSHRDSHTQAVDAPNRPRSSGPTRPPPSRRTAARQEHLAVGSSARPPPNRDGGKPSQDCPGSPALSSERSDSLPSTTSPTTKTVTRSIPELKPESGSSHETLPRHPITAPQRQSRTTSPTPRNTQPQLHPSEGAHPTHEKLRKSLPPSSRLPKMDQIAEGIELCGFTSASSALAGC